MSSASLTDLDRFDFIGFDLDGTLYDEFEFVDQVYRTVADRYKFIWGPGHLSAAHAFMCSEWLETGSSKSRAFDKVFRKFGVKSEGLLSEYVADCLAIYRETVPVLTLAPRASFLISQLPREKIFLITDGQLTTQKNKFNALGLDAFFRPDHVFFTGAYGSDYYKPNTAILGKIQLPLHGAKVAYVGDREVDEDFSRAANWSFYRVSVMRG